MVCRKDVYPNADFSRLAVEIVWSIMQKENAQDSDGGKRNARQRPLQTLAESKICAPSACCGSATSRRKGGLSPLANNQNALGKLYGLTPCNNARAGSVDMRIVDALSADIASGRLARGHSFKSPTKAVQIVLKSTSIRQAAGELPQGAGFPQAYRC